MLSKHYNIGQLKETAELILNAATSKTLCFYGTMGAGKTTLIKALVKQLEGHDTANSPTFGIVNEYHFQEGNLLGYHFDFYRLNDETEALDLGLEDYLAQDCWVFMEWPEKIPSFLPIERTEIQIEILDEVTRELHITNI
ncbi:tRNA (adenosine(37)-N6)-threonylcarbamoyltransferase complex ATPase subunit type 1 TsaE [Maribacter algicola]|uniref:tRNA (Adenosine(37)-N6)-threonylcarbamoyltransferase complex ATPase subunit type 1 TsaE n=1 Tax=Meishania litoralis TaxID=3434685 RepID=A0ACC7LKI8_9FLAO